MASFVSKIGLLNMIYTGEIISDVLELKVCPHRQKHLFSSFKFLSLFVKGRRLFIFTTKMILFFDHSCLITVPVIALYATVINVFQYRCFTSGKLC